MAMTLEEQRERWKINQKNFRLRHPDYDREYYARNREKLNQRAKDRYRRLKLQKSEAAAKLMSEIRRHVVIHQSC